MREFFEYYEEGIEKIKGGLKVLIVSFLIIFFIFTLIKTFFLNRPKIKPGEIAISYLKAEQSAKRELAESYLHPDLKKVEIFGKNYEEFKIYQIHQKEREGEEPVFETKEKRIEKNKARVNVFEKTNKNQGWFFFEFYLPEEISFEVILEKIGNWKKGYEWKIIKIDSSDLIKRGKVGEKVEFEKGVFIRLIEIEDFKPENVIIPEGIKILSLKVEYENNSDKEIKINSFENWSIIDEKGNIFSPPSISSPIALREPVLMGIELKSGEKRFGYTVFEVPKEIEIKEIIYKDWQRKIIFQHEK
jgi:hypothetical protein